MKRTILTILLAVVVLCACSAGGSKDESANQAETTNLASGEALPTDKDLSYAFGFALGTDLKNFEIDYDYDEFMKGFKDVIEGKETRMTLEEAMTKIQQTLTAVMDRQMQEAQEAEKVFFAENGKKPGIITTASGLQYEVITPAEGPKPSAEQTVVVNYQGTLTDGTVFDSSYQRGQPAEFPLNFVIPGWTEGMQLMSIGSKYRFYVPSNLGYGPQGAGNGQIPPFASLIFEVELLEIKETDPSMFQQGF
ncbi:MAG: FKBP-type peptidyl-prolyl cis-trans isomerase [Treponema sp.]|jgi:FKBP-type peptidyl-prolyl cis-trans isomerase|nr:FKBP-type peptidyl-prolyl cis-trans isomerase [Treponema sp.]